MMSIPFSLYPCGCLIDGRPGYSHISRTHIHHRVSCRPVFFFWGGGRLPPPQKKSVTPPPKKNLLLTLFFIPRGPRLLPPPKSFNSPPPQKGKSCRKSCTIFNTSSVWAHISVAHSARLFEEGRSTCRIGT